MICPENNKPCRLDCTEWDTCSYRPQGAGLLFWAAISLLLAACLGVALMSSGCMVAYVKIEGTDPALYGHHQDTGGGTMTVTQDIQPRIADTLAEAVGAKITGNAVKVASDNKAEVKK
jgi:hypothetical protein